MATGWHRGNVSTRASKHKKVHAAILILFLFLQKITHTKR